MTTAPSRLVLEGVPRVQFFEGEPRCPEDIPFRRSCVPSWNMPVKRILGAVRTARCNRAAKSAVATPFSSA